jgi:signal transduction histidine kinase
MLLRQVLSSTSFRLGLVQVVAFAIAVSLLIAYVSTTMSSWLKHTFDQDIRDDIVTLADQANSRGLDAAAESIQRLLADPENNSEFYLLIDGEGRRLAGNAPRAPQGTGWVEMPLSSKVNSSGKPKDSEHYLRGEVRKVRDGATLLVGEDMWPAGQVREVVIRGIAITFVAIVALAMLLSLMMSLSMLRRIEAIDKASREIIGGNFDRRIAIGNAKDEFGRLATQLNVMLDRITELMCDIRQVTNNVAHDLRTPLGRVRQYLETARRRARSVGDYERTIDSAIAQIDGLLSTFQAMLQVAQIESGSRRSTFASVDLWQLLTRLVDLYAAVAEDRGQVLTHDLTPNIRVTGDQELLQQMFVNLIENAITHASRGSHVEVALSFEAGQPIATVADTGPGIPESLRLQVLKPFVRIEQQRSTAGSGLGLAIVAAIARLHEIDLQLADNRPGLRVTLRFKSSSTSPASEAPGSDRRTAYRHWQVWSWRRSALLSSRPPFPGRPEPFDTEQIRPDENMHVQAPTDST